MKLLIMKSAWEVFDKPLEHFFERLLSEQWDGMEYCCSGRQESLSQIEMHQRASTLPYIAQISSQGRTPQEHKQSLRNAYQDALQIHPLFITSQTGKDFFSFEENAEIFKEALTLENEFGIPILHETHRGRALYSIPSTLFYLKIYPQLRLTGDFTHFFCTHESDLQDQDESLQIILDRCDHLHARIGYSAGPQVPDPRLKSYLPWVTRSFDLWKQVFQQAEKRGMTTFTITPEFGPFPYRCGLETPWELNVWMRDQLYNAFPMYK